MLVSLVLALLPGIRAAGRREGESSKRIPLLVPSSPIK